MIKLTGTISISLVLVLICGFRRLYHLANILRNNVIIPISLADKQPIGKLSLAKDAPD
jgi:hypothetical protein